jgi:hypothetical protein
MNASLLVVKQKIDMKKVNGYEYAKVPALVYPYIQIFSYSSFCITSMGEGEKLRTSISPRTILELYCKLGSNTNPWVLY